jgi:hypothetical protein
MLYFDMSDNTLLASENSLAERFNIETKGQVH